MTTENGFMLPSLVKELRTAGTFASDTNRAPVDLGRCAAMTARASRSRSGRVMGRTSSSRELEVSRARVIRAEGSSECAAVGLEGVAAGGWIFVLPTEPPAAALAPGHRAVGKGSRRHVEQAAGERVRFRHDPC